MELLHSVMFLFQFIGDNEFIWPTIRTVLNIMNYTEVYFYEFTYEGTLGKLVNGYYQGNIKFSQHE